MGNDIVKGYKVDENSKISGGSCSDFNIFKGIRIKDKKEVSIFFIKKKNNKTKLELFKKEANNLIKFRHPSFLQVLEPIHEETKHIAFITERIENTWEIILKNKDDLGDELELKMKFKELLEGLYFINYDKNYGHFNIKPSTIFLTKNSQFKIGGMALLRSLTDNTETLNSLEFDILDYHFCDPHLILNKKVNKSSDLYSLCLIFEKLLRNLNKIENYLNINVDKSNYNNFINNLKTIWKNKFLNSFDNNLKFSIENIVFKNIDNRIDIKTLKNCKYFKDPLLKILNLITNFVTIEESEQVNFINLVNKNLNKFSKNIIKNRIVEFFKINQINKALIPHILLGYFYLIEENILDDSFNCKFIKSNIFEIIKQKNMTSNSLYTIIYNINNLVKIFDKEEIINVLYPLYWKSLECNIVNIQIITIVRGNTIIKYLDKKEQLFVKISQFFLNKNWQLKLESLKFILNHLNIIDNNLKIQVILPCLENLCGITDLNSNIYEISYKILKNLSSSSNFTTNQNKILPVALKMLLYSNVYKETFEELYKFVNQLISNCHSRKNELESKVIDDYKGVEEKKISEFVKSIKLNNNEFNLINEGNYIEDKNEIIGMSMDNLTKDDLFKNMKVKSNVYNAKNEDLNVFNINTNNNIYKNNLIKSENIVKDNLDIFNFDKSNINNNSNINYNNTSYNNNNISYNNSNNTNKNYNFLNNINSNEENTNDLDLFNINKPKENLNNWDFNLNSNSNNKQGNKNYDILNIDLI